MLFCDRVLIIIAAFCSILIEFAATVSLRECKENNVYNTRDFIPIDEARYRSPMLLLSFEGSGNTWTRLLLEYGAGIYTGSIYNDHRLIGVLPAENYCGRQASVIKAHPHNVELYNESYEDNGESRLRLSANTINGTRFKLCKNEFILFHRFLIIVRDPYQSIWAEYQRSHTPKGYHNAGIRLNEFNQLKWDESEAIELAKDYELHWNRLYGRVFTQLKPEDYFIIKYDDLLDPIKRINILKEAINFMNVSYLSSSVTEERLECAFQLAETPEVHRTINMTDMVTISQVYSSKTTVCNMWYRFQNMVGFLNLNYSIWNNIVC